LKQDTFGAKVGGISVEGGRVAMSDLTWMEKRIKDIMSDAESGRAKPDWALEMLERAQRNWMEDELRRTDLVIGHGKRALILPGFFLWTVILAQIFVGVTALSGFSIVLLVAIFACGNAAYLAFAFGREIRVFLDIQKARRKIEALRFQKRAGGSNSQLKKHDEASSVNTGTQRWKKSESFSFPQTRVAQPR
jgi:hypothetical protein